MSLHERRSGQFVVPGTILGVIEEFTPGSGTYVEEGNIRSKTTGCTLLDVMNKKISVYPFIQAASVPGIGSIVSGQVLEVKSKRAVLRISQIEKRPLSGFFTGILYISDVSPRYVEGMSSVCKAGDMMRAKVISDKNRRFYLSTAEKELGVVLAFCSRCGHDLMLRRHSMRCPRCGNIEKRKIASQTTDGEE